MEGEQSPPIRGFYYKILVELGEERVMAAAAEIAATGTIRNPAACFTRWANKQRKQYNG